MFCYIDGGKRDDKTFSIAQNMRSVCANHCNMAPNKVFNAWISSNSLSLLLLLARRLTHHRKWALKTISCPSTYKSFTKDRQEEHTVLCLGVKKNVLNYKCIQIKGKAVETSLSLHGRSSGVNIAFWVICFLQALNCCSHSLFTCLCLRSLFLSFAFLSSFHPPLFLALAHHPSFSLSFFHPPQPLSSSRWRVFRLTNTP